MSEFKYLNFPIVMLKGFLNELPNHEDFQNLLENIMMFHLYNHSLLLENDTYVNEDQFDRFKKSVKYFNLDLKNIDNFYENSEKIYNKYVDFKVFTGLNILIFWDYYNCEKKEFDYYCLIAHLSFKSILGKKKYTKSNYEHLQARMSGFESTKDDISKRLSLSRYQLDKIRKNLELYWDLKYYSNHTRGFYFGYKNISLEDLIEIAIKNKEKNKLKLLYERKKEAEMMVILKNKLMK